MPGGGYGGGGYGGSSYGDGWFGLGAPDLRLLDAREICPNGIAIGFNYSLADLPVTWTPASYKVTPVGASPTPTVTGVHDVYDPAQVALELDQDMVFGETYTVEVVGALVSLDGEPMEVGYTTAQFTYWWWYSSDRPRDPGEEKILKVWTDGVGRALSDLSGYHMTRLLEAYAYGDTEMVVDGSLNFPDAGTVIVGGRHVAGRWQAWRFDYTDREPSRLLGVTAHDPTDRLIVDPTDHDGPNTGEIPAGTLVLDWARDYSHVDRAKQSAFCQRAQTAMLDRASGRAGLGRPYGMDDALFQALIAALVYQERCRWPDLYRVLRAALQDWWINLNGQYVVDREVVEGGGLDFKAWMVGHYIEDQDTDVVYQVRSVDVTGGRLHLSQYGSPWWQGFPSVGMLGEIRSFRLMPFWIQQIRPAEADPDQRIIIRIMLHLPIDAWPPGTYFLDPTYVGDWETPADWADPPRGVIEETAEDAGPGFGGSHHPPYLSGMTAEAAPGAWLLRILDQVLPSGYRLETLAYPAL